MYRILIAGVLACGLFAQPAAKRPSFELASVRLNTVNGPTDIVPRRSGDRVSMHNTQLGSIVGYAYHLTNLGLELEGNYRLPDGWNWYDIEAIAPGSPGDDELRLMFQTLLEDRFKLSVHRETKQGFIYDLVIGKGGSKLKPAAPEIQVTVDGKPIHAGAVGVVGGLDGPHLVGNGATAEQLASSLIGQLKAVVRDRTGLVGTFSYNVVFARDDPSDLSGLPTLESALQQELGLRLEKNKGTVEVLVVDHVEKPTPN
jgi:uncharacterized protein (TIGR03435 family)